MMHDAISYGLTYEACTITKDIKLPNGVSLKRGDEYETVYFLFKEEKFQFVSHWVMNKITGEMDPHHSSLIVPQKDLAPFLNWDNPPIDSLENTLPF
jgi:hypothetical protein